ncbi:MAG: hypothetical protein ACSHX8_07900 [Opitutaceae bacterium]
MEKILKASRLLLVEYLVLMLIFYGIEPVSGILALLAILGLEIYFSKEERKVSGLPLICLLTFCGGIIFLWLIGLLNPDIGPAGIVIFLPLIGILNVIPAIAYIIFAFYDLSGKLGE